MADAIAVVNAGSSSLKFSLFALRGETLELAVRGHIEGLIDGEARFTAKDVNGAVIAEHRWPEGESPGQAGAVKQLLAFVNDDADDLNPVAVGHRIVHGGMRYVHPAVIDERMLDELDALVPLAPLHQPHNLAPIRTLATQAPALLQVACFDTAFHATQPSLAQAFALPPSITDRGVKRFGFHGLSYEYIASVLPALDPVAARGRVVVAHLGNGASMCAMHGGRSVASTMGMTALDGLMMGTRSGAIDPGVILYLLDELGMEARGIENLLYERSGLLGVSGLSSDMRELLDSYEPRARMAVDLFCYRAGRELGSLAAALGGIDALVFTAGIGENAAPVREAIVRNAEWLGFDLDLAANAVHATRITMSDSEVPAYIIPTNEELMIARHVRTLLGQQHGAA